MPSELSLGHSSSTLSKESLPQQVEVQLLDEGPKNAKGKNFWGGITKGTSANCWKLRGSNVGLTSDTSATC